MSRFQRIAAPTALLLAATLGNLVVPPNGAADPSPYLPADAPFVMTPVLPARGGGPVTPVDLATLVDVGDPVLSPDGRRLAVMTWQAFPESNGYRFTWHILDASTGQDLATVDGGEIMRPLVENAAWSGAIVGEVAVWSSDGQWIYYRKRQGEDLNVWRTSADGRTTQQVTHESDWVERFSLLGDSQLLFSISPGPAAKRRQIATESLDGYRFDDRFIPSFNHKPVISPQVQANLLLRNRVVDAGATRRQDVSGGPSSPARDAAGADLAVLPPPSARSTGPETDARRAWSEADHPELGLGAYGPQSLYWRGPGGKVKCADELCKGQIASVGLSPDGEEVFYTRAEGVNYLARTIYAWRPSTQKIRVVHKGLGQRWGQAECQFRAGFAVCGDEEPDRPRRLTRIDLRSGKSTTLFEPNAWFATRRHGRIVRFEITNSFGQPAFAMLVLPDTATSRPPPLVVVTYRARGFLRGGVGDEYPVYPLAANGFAVLVVDRPEAWRELAAAPDGATAELGEMSGMRERRSTLETIELAVQHAVSLGLADPDAVAITGLSDGAETTNYAISHSTTFRTAIASSGSWEPMMGFVGTQNAFKALGLDSTHFRDEPYVQEQSVALRADKVCAPFLVNASESEYLTFMEPLRTLRAKGKIVELYVYTDEYHIKWQPAHRLAVYNRNIAWLSFWLQGVERNDLVADGEIAGWKTLRETGVKGCQAGHPTP